MSDTNVTPEVENAFEAPKADLTNTSTEKPILEMERFSAWGVFGLSIITFGIYWVYWMYTRITQLNGLSEEKKVNVNYLNAYIGLYIVNLVFSIVNSQDTAIVIASGVISLVSFIVLMIVIFSARRVIEEVINKGSAEPVALGGVMTFFFQVIYFQYKINEAIDNQSNQ